MCEGALHGFAVERVQVVVLIVSEGVEARWLAPQVGILRVVELMLDDCQLLVSLEVIHHRCGSFQRIDVELLAVGMHIHRLGRVDVRICCRLVTRSIKLLLADEFDADAPISRLCRLTNLGTYQLCNRRN